MIITMARESEQLSSLSNPLASIDQLSTSSSQLDGIPAYLENSLRFAGAQLTQAAGILLRLPQETIAQAIVILQRFFIGSEGGSFKINAVKVRPQLYALKVSDRGLSANRATGCLCRIVIHDDQNLISASVDPISAKCLRLSPLPPVSSATAIGKYEREREARC